MGNKFTTSEKGIALIAEYEGEILHVYDDGFGYPTAGIGHLLTAAERKQFPLKTKITRPQSREWLKKDLAEAETAVNNGVKVPITQHQFDAMVSLTFNIGVGAFTRSSLLKNLNNRKFAAASDSFLSWNKVKGEPVKGLTRRRKAEREMFLTPDSTAPAVKLKEQAGISNSALAPDSQPSIDQTGATSASSEITKKTEAETKDGTESVAVSTTVGQNVVIEKRQPTGFFETIWKKITALSIFNGGVDAATEKAQQVQALGLSPEFWTRVGWIVLIASVVYLLFEAYKHFSHIREEKALDQALALANSTPNNFVQFAPTEYLQEFREKGYKVITR